MGPMKQSRSIMINLVGYVGLDQSQCLSRSSSLRTGIEKLRESFLGRGQDIVDKELLRQAPELR